MESTMNELFYREMGRLYDKIDKNHNAVMHEITVNREEFVIFKTKVNTRTAVISTAIGAVFMIVSLALTVSHNNKKKLETEQLRDQVKTEQPKQA